MDQDELYHYGVKGMKWGVRRYQNKDGTLTPAGEKHYYGMTKKKAVAAIKKSGQDNYKKVMVKYKKEFDENEKYNQLGRESNKIANELLDLRERGYDKPSKQTSDLAKKHRSISNQMAKIEVEIGKKYVNELNDTRLKDIGYSGSIEKGREMLQSYNLDYRIRSDGFIYEAGLRDVDPYRQYQYYSRQGVYSPMYDGYLRPWDI